MKFKYIRYFLLGALATLILIQFIKIDKTNPQVIIDQDLINSTNPPQEVASLLKGACYDCHSNETAYPWYTDYQPMAWWVKGHIKEGKKHLNFSIWSTYEQKRKDHKIEECIEEIAGENMPLSSYTWTHEQAKLSSTDRDLLVNWFKSL